MMTQWATAGRSRRLLATGLAGLGLLAPFAGAQETKPAPATAGDLATRYRLIEQYSSKDKLAAGEVGTYQVAFKNTLSRVTEKAAGAPDRAESVVQAICTERPAVVGGVDARQVPTLLRRYEKVQITPDPWPKGPIKPLEGLTVSVRTIPDGLPEVLAISPERRLLEQEYRFIANQVLTPDLAYLLPDLPARIGDTWAIPRQGADALVGGPIIDGVLAGKLVEVKADPKGLDRIAELSVTGRVHLGIQDAQADTTVNAQVRFLAPTISVTGVTAAATAKDAPRPDEAPVDLRGSIVSVRRAQVSTLPLVKGEKGRRSLRSDLVLERRPPVGAPLRVPVKLPDATEANSWLIYVDPKGRFSFSIPQSFQTDSAQTTGDRVGLVADQADGSRDRLGLVFRPDGQIQPDDYFKAIIADLKQRGGEVVSGTTQVLPAAEWPGMRVTRGEAAVRLPDQTRLHVYGYVILFGRNSSLTANAATVAESPAAFRKTVESALKTFKLGPPDGK